MTQKACCYSELPSTFCVTLGFTEPWCAGAVKHFPIIYDDQSGTWKSDGNSSSVPAELSCSGNFIDSTFTLDVEGCYPTTFNYPHDFCDGPVFGGEDNLLVPAGQACCGYGYLVSYHGLVEGQFLPGAGRPVSAPCDCCPTAGSGSDSSGGGSDGGCPGGLCGSGPGPGGGRNGEPQPYSSRPIRYATGELLLRSRDISARGFGDRFGHTRGYVHRLSSHETIGQGHCWLIEEQPHLVLGPGTIIVMGDAGDALWFDESGGGYVGRFGIRETLSYDGGTDTYSLAAPDGTVTTFDFDGKMTARTSPGGQTISVTSRHSDGWHPLTVDRSVTISGVTTTERLEYEYTTVSADVALSRVMLRRKVGAGSWEDVERASYAYYTSAGSFGIAGDLKTVTTEVWDGSSWVSTGVTLYRYYTASSQAHLLKYVVNPSSYARLAADPGVSDPLTASDTTVAAYADYYFEYDSARRVTKEKVEGGSKTYDFAYATSGNSAAAGNWETKTVETLPGGAQNIVYTNADGRILLREFTDGTDSWVQYQEFDSNGRRTLLAHPSAVTSYDDTADDLDVVLKTSDGLIEVWEYWTTTGSGGVAGELKAEKVKKGTSGTPVLLREYEYTTQTAGGATVIRVSKEKVYRNDDGTGAVETTYAYTWHSGTTRVEQVTTTLPAVPTTQNGSNVAATRVERFDLYGNLLWTKDERGVITKYVIDPVLGAPTQRIDDVDTTQVSDEPSGWATVSGFGLHLMTDFAYDAKGRLIRTLGPAHEADVSGTPTSVRTATWNVYVESASGRELRTAVGYGSGTGYATYTLINPVSITKTDAEGRLLEEIRATRGSGVTSSGALSASDTFAQSSYVAWTTHQRSGCCDEDSVRVYHDIPSSGAGSAGTNYGQTDFGEDATGRRNKVKSPGGTITRTVFDARGLAIETWVGTNDTGATDSDPTGGGATGNDMVLVSEREYDAGLDGGDGLLTEQTLYASATDLRVTAYVYDWRGRLVDTDGEEGFFERRYYDNLGRVTKAERYDGSSSGTLLARSETFFDERGRVYRTKRYAVDPSNGTVGNALTDDTWFDAAGNVIKSLPSGAKLFRKTVYDGLGRVAKTYLGYDLDETAYSESSSVSDDVVLEQSEMTYNEAGNPTKSLARQRYHDATGTGELTTPGGLQPKARVTYFAAWFDAIGRQIANADYGTNGGSSLSRPSSIPSRSDTCLVAEIFFDAAGRAYRVIRPTAREDRTEFDDRGRRTKVIENYKDGTVSSAAPDEDRTTQWTYTADGQVATLKAVNPDTGDQTTTYVYGTTLSDSGVARSDLKRAEIYPDSDDVASPLGNGTDGVYDRVEFKYDRLGAATEVKDQNGTVHAYNYDKLGRITQDRVTTLGTGIDGAVRRIETAYAKRGMRSRVTSLDNAAVGSGTVLNEVACEYNAFGQLVTEYQGVDAAVNTSTTPKVQYAYADGSGNTTRQTGLTYPNGRALTYGYGSSGSADDAASRVASITDGSTQLVGYSYLGAAVVVEVDYPEPDLKYTLIGTAGGTDSDTGDVYRGLDRFGRVKDAYWRDYGAGSDAARLKYGYDRGGNRLWRQDAVAVGQSKDFDELYAYDGLDRLLDARRGRLNSGKTALNTTTFAQDWSLDATGNWTRFREDTDGDSTWDLIQNRTADKANQISGITETSGPAWADPAYDLAGNTTTLPKPDSPTAAITATYDAWNRLVKLSDTTTSQTIQEDAYDGRRFRSIRKSYSSGTLSETRRYFHAAGWRLIEERVGTSSAAARQFVWGLRYIDDLALRDRDTDANGSLDERLYALQDENWNVVGVARDNGDLEERYIYSPYGLPFFLTPLYVARSAPSYTWNVFYSGHALEPAGIFFIRRRAQSPLTGWLTRDPIASTSAELYDRVRSNPVLFVDPTGLAACSKEYCTIDAPWKGLVEGSYYVKAEVVGSDCRKGTLRLTIRDDKHGFDRHGEWQGCGEPATGEITTEKQKNPGPLSWRYQSKSGCEVITYQEDAPGITPHYDTLSDVCWRFVWIVECPLKCEFEQCKPEFVTWNLLGPTGSGLAAFKLRVDATLGFPSVACCKTTPCSVGLDITWVAEEDQDTARGRVRRGDVFPTQDNCPENVLERNRDAISAP